MADKKEDKKSKVEFKVENPVKDAPEAKQGYVDINDPKHANKTYEDLQNEV